MAIRTTLIAATVGMSIASTAFAGGPVLTAEDAYVQEARPSSEGRWVIPVIVGLLVVGAALASGGGSDVCNGPDDQPQPDPVCE